ncbi:hypothetical protein [Carboxylicivirga sp. RSCT41]|uniref:hypothetical protein n=1 Tax=Carboxylicivirga agarovorans TaxID=3417570 RepID=UPI003D340062
MLEGYKTVLKGVRDSEFLFRKELRKTLSWITPEEQIELIDWVKLEFSDTHAGIIKEILSMNVQHSS